MGISVKFRRQARDREEREAWNAAALVQQARQTSCLLCGLKCPRNSSVAAALSSRPQSALPGHLEEQGCGTFRYVSAVPGIRSARAISNCLCCHRSIWLSAAQNTLSKPSPPAVYSAQRTQRALQRRSTVFPSLGRRGVSGQQPRTQIQKIDRNVTTRDRVARCCGDVHLLLAPCNVTIHL